MYLFQEKLQRSYRLNGLLQSDGALNKLYGYIIELMHINEIGQMAMTLGCPVVSGLMHINEIGMKGDNPTMPKWKHCQPWALQETLHVGVNQCEESL